MRIALDARWIFPEISGIGAYTRDLARALAHADSSNEYLLLFSDPAVRDRTLAETGLDAAPNVRAVAVPYGVFSPRSQLDLPVRLRRLGADLYHAPNYMIPLCAFPRRRLGRIRCVTTIHDVIPMVFPQAAPRSRKARLYPLYRWIMREVGRRSDRIVTDSKASAADIVRHLRLDAALAANLRVIPCGVGARFRPAAARPPRAADRVRSVLYVGRFDPYKNVAVLIRAFARARAASPFPLRLTLAGAPDARYPETRALVRELGLGDAVAWTGYLSDAQLVTAYQGADVLAHPSRYEGFGLQVLEAMACGVPVVCSNAASLPEVAGDAAILQNPDDEKGFAQAIARVLTDDALAADLSSRGLRQAAQFTWERAARATLDVYRELTPPGV